MLIFHPARALSEVAHDTAREFCLCSLCRSSFRIDAFLTFPRAKSIDSSLRCWLCIPYTGSGFQRRSRLGCPRAVGERRRRRRRKPVRTGAALHHAPFSPAALLGDRRPDLLCRAPGALLHHVLHGGGGVQVKDWLSLMSPRERASCRGCQTISPPFPAFALLSSFLGCSVVFTRPSRLSKARGSCLRLAMGHHREAVLVLGPRPLVWLRRVATLTSGFVHLSVTLFVAASAPPLLLLRSLLGVSL